MYILIVWQNISQNRTYRFDKLVVLLQNALQVSAPLRDVSAQSERRTHTHTHRIILPWQHTPPGQANVRVSVHKYLEVHQLQKGGVAEGKDSLKHHHIGSVHCVLGTRAGSVAGPAHRATGSLTLYLALAWVPKS